MSTTIVYADPVPPTAAPPGTDNAKPPQNTAAPCPEPILVCPTDCGDSSAHATANQYAIALNKCGERRKAVEYLENCEQQCPHYDCLTAILLRAASRRYSPQIYADKMWRYGRACLRQLDPNMSEADRRFIEDELARTKNLAEMAVQDQKLAQHRTSMRNIGLGLQIGGAVIAATGLAFGVAVETTPIPVAGSCGSLFATQGCVLSQNAGRAIYIPLLAIGLTATGSGIGLMVHNREPDGETR